MPPLHQHSELSVPGHEPGPGRIDAVPTHGFHGATGGGTGPVEESVHEFGRLGTRAQDEFALQHVSATVERAHCGGPVTGSDLERHECAVPRFLQRLELHAAVRETERSDLLSRFGEEGYDVVTELDALAEERRSLFDDPLSVGAGHEITAVFGDRSGRVDEERFDVPRGLRPRCFVTLAEEHADVDPAGGAVAPGQGGRLHDERRLLTEHVSQVVQLASQVRARLGLVRVRPEDKGEVLASLRNAGTQHEVGQKVERSGR
jgi:hypothetical protein